MRDVTVNFLSEVALCERRALICVWLSVIMVQQLDRLVNSGSRVLFYSLDVTSGRDRRSQKRLLGPWLRGGKSAGLTNGVLRSIGRSLSERRTIDWLRCSSEVTECI